MTVHNLASAYTKLAGSSVPKRRNARARRETRRERGAAFHRYGVFPATLPSRKLDQPMRQLRRYLLDRMVLRPSRVPLDAEPKQRVMLRYGADDLETFVERTPLADGPPEVLILKFPGNAGRGERATNFPVEFLPEHQCAVWTWNPPGYGGSQGRASLERIADAAIEFWDQVLERDGRGTPTILLCGNSLGCATALHVAAQVCGDRPHTGMVLRNPPPLTQVVKQIARRYPMGRLVTPIAESLIEQMDAVSTAAEARIPAVFLQSELDELVPVSMQQLVVDAFAGKHRVVTLQGLDHGGIPDQNHLPAIRDAIEWLWDEVSQPA